MDGFSIKCGLEMSAIRAIPQEISCGGDLCSIPG